MKKVREEKVKKRKRIKVIKAPRVQTIFCIISLVFVLVCCGFYGYRLVKYYKIYNPKSESGETLTNLSSHILSTSSIVFEGDGLYSSNGNYVYKGIDVNNYILINDMMFRIIRINMDKSIDIVLDEYINKLGYSDSVVSYNESSIKKYLEEKFLPSIDSDVLMETSICLDPISELSEVNCENMGTTSISLLGITDFLNSMNDSKTYLTASGEYLWLYNHAKDNVWHTNGNGIANSNSSNLYGIKPVLTLKNSNVYISGDGSYNNPYQIKESDKNINVGTYLDINDDIYIVYEVGEDYFKIESNEVLSDKLIFDKKTNDYTESSLKEYLEGDYIESLSYKDILKEVDFSSYNSLIGLLSLNDLKFNSSLRDYFLSDQKDNDVYLYNSSILGSSVSAKRNVRVGLGIKKDLNIISGNGSKLAPFIVEVK
ncbi:MAG: hypothetical protein IJ501_06335 [Bacilli bacterium]|nr:hypothetical protein [Bacilli bacterium]